MIRHLALVRLFLLWLIVALTGGCGSWFTRDDPLETLPVDEMYEAGHDALSAGNYSRATRYFQRLVARFPFGRYTEQAQLELAYTQLKNNEPEEALSTINRFIKTYPAHRNIEYAYFLKAVINFDRENFFLDRLARIDRTMRDQNSLMTSFNDFAELIRRYPNGRYAADARQRMVHLRNLLARHEILVGKYYLRRGGYLAAVKRGQYVLELFSRSAHQGDALALMAEGYQRLGQDTLAKDARRVLEKNDPEHPYLSGEWEGTGLSWWRRILPFAGESRG